MEDQIKEFCNRFVGYDNVKKELLRILEWYKDKDIVNNKNVDLVKGILFYGPAGNGKTTILKEYSKCFNCPVYNVSGIKLDDVDLLSKEISEMFKCARSEKFAIILIDEIDQLFDLSPKMLRLFQTELDGISSNRNILILGATNKGKENFPPSLLRTGRFDRTIYIGYPTIKDREYLISKFLCDLNVSPLNKDFNKLAKKMINCSCVDIKLIINDAYLRYKDKINDYAISNSYLIIKRGIIPSRKCRTIKKREAINYASKALLLLNYQDFINFKSVKVIGDEIVVDYENKYEKDYGTDYLFINVDYSLSGIAGEKLINGYYDTGNVLDIEKVNNSVHSAIEHEGLQGINNYLRVYFEKKDRYDSNKKNERIDKTINKVILSHFKSVYKYLKKNINILKEISNILIRNNEFNLNDAKKLGLID